MKEYIYSIVATRFNMTLLRHEIHSDVGICLANSDAEAIGIAVTRQGQVFPQSEGWAHQGHRVRILELLEIQET